MDHQGGMSVLVSVPRTVFEAEEWVERAAVAAGPGFDPGRSFGDYEVLRVADEQLVPDDGTVAQLDAALEAARSLLGGRIVDLAYWTIAGVLDDWDPAWAQWAHPLTQPPSRFWLVERPDLVPGPDCSIRRSGWLLRIALSVGGFGSRPPKVFTATPHGWRRTSTTLPGRTRGRWSGPILSDCASPR